MEVREATYHALIKPTGEYSSADWDPYLATDINMLGQVHTLFIEYTGKQLPAVSPRWLLNLAGSPLKKDVASTGWRYSTRYSVDW